MSKKITIKFTCPKLTKDKIHTVVIEDDNLYDTWDSVKIFKNSKDFTHDLNVSADSLGHMDMIHVNLYPFYVDEDGETQTDYGQWIKCKVLDVKGDKNVSTRYFRGVKHFGYRKNKNLT